MSRKSSRQKPRRLFGRRSQRAARSASFIQSSYGRRLRVEMLEDRRMLAGVTVGTALDVVNAPDVTSIAALIANDGGDGISLREAITAANNTGGSDTITFDASVFTGGAASVIRLQLGQLPLITEAVHLDGGSQQVVISGDANGDDMLIAGTFNTDIAASDTAGVLGDNNGRILDVTAPASDEVRLTGLTITGGNVSGLGGGIISGDSALVIENSSISGNRATSVGGGISISSGNVTLTSSTVSGNSSGDNGGGISGGRGGGISASSGNVTLISSTVSGNIVIAPQYFSHGGGIYTSTGNVTLTSSTVSGNSTMGTFTYGGGISTFSGNVTLTSSTVTANSAAIANNFAKKGGGIALDVSGSSSTESLSLTNSIVAGNLVNGLPSDIFASLTAANDLTASHSLIGTNFSTSFAEAQTADANGNLIGTSANPINALLGLLANNGGLTQTIALLPGSPAIDAGNSARATDQRGFTRPLDFPSIVNATGGNSSDIGAFELQTPAFTSPASADVAENTHQVHTLVATNADLPAQTINLSILGQSPAGDLGPGQSLLAEQSIQSADGSHTLLFQADGNFVVYNSSGGAVWASDTGGTGADIASMQTDGNLVIYVAGTPVFSTNTDGNPLSRLHLANDGTPMVLRIDGVTLWQGTLGNVSGGGTTFSPPALDASFATGADNSLFEVAGGGQLQFITAPDFEVPGDANGDNIYEVTVLADDGNGGVTPQTIFVTVVNIPESPPLVVDTTSDVSDGDFSTGQFSLREAIELANADIETGTITFDANVFTGGASSLIRLGGTELAITDSLTIDGSTGTDIVITADANNDDTTVGVTDITDVANNTNTSDNSRVFFIGTGDTTLRGLTLTGGFTDTSFEGGGGGIRSNSAGTVTLDQSTVSGNSSTFDGGGIYTGSSTVTLNSSIVSGNGSGDNGGGIRTYSGNVTLTGSTISGNTSNDDGGGIYTGSGTVTLNSSIVSDNGSGDNGGGIRTYSGNVTLISSTVSGNIATGNFADGGGIYARSGAVALTSSTVSGNSSSDDGGGISTFSGPVTLSSSTVNGNSSSDSGGGITAGFGDVTLTSSTVSGNSSGGNGGGIYAFAGAVTLASSTVSANSAAGVGGGIALDPNGFSYTESLSLINSIVAGNLENGLASDININPSAPLTASFSLIGTNVGTSLAEAQSADANGNLIGTSTNLIDLELGTLADNGGPTQTHALLPGSPAIDAGNATLTTDQRGFARPVDLPSIPNAAGGNGSDIGAFEAQVLLLGDYNLNGTVDAADYTVWLDTLGSSVAAFAGADGDGVIDQDDYNVWKANFGNTAPPATATATVIVQSSVQVVESLPAESEPVAEPVTVVSPAEVVTTPAPLPASLNSELVDLAFAFVIQDRNDFVPRSKAILTNPSYESATDDGLLSFYDDAAHSPSTTETTNFAKPHDERARDSIQRRDAWEDALDEVFGEAFAEEVITV